MARTKTVMDGGPETFAARHSVCDELSSLIPKAKDDSWRRLFRVILPEFGVDDKTGSADLLTPEDLDFLHEGIKAALRGSSDSVIDGEARLTLEASLTKSSIQLIPNPRAPIQEPLFEMPATA